VLIQKGWLMRKVEVGREETEVAVEAAQAKRTGKAVWISETAVRALGDCKQMVMEWGEMTRTMPMTTDGAIVEGALRVYRAELKSAAELDGSSVKGR